MIKEAGQPSSVHPVGVMLTYGEIIRWDVVGIVIVSSDTTPSVMSSLLQPNQLLCLPQKEAPTIIAGTSSRPADVFLPTWSRGQPAALDVTVMSPLQQQTVSGAANSPEYALNVGIDRKLAANVVSCRENGVHFVPLMVETLGGWSAEASETITRIGHLLQQ